MVALLSSKCGMKPWVRTRHTTQYAAREYRTLSPIALGVAPRVRTLISLKIRKQMKTSAQNAHGSPRTMATRSRQAPRQSKIWKPLAMFRQLLMVSQY